MQLLSKPICIIQTQSGTKYRIIEHIDKIGRHYQEISGGQFGYNGYTLHNISPMISGMPFRGQFRDLPENGPYRGKMLRTSPIAQISFEHQSQNQQSSMSCIDTSDREQEEQEYY